MHAIPPAATGNPAHQRTAVAAASRGGGRDARGANGRPTAAGEGRDARGANGQPFTTNEPSPAAATRGKGGRGRPNPPWFTPPSELPQRGWGRGCRGSPPAKLPATRGGQRSRAKQRETGRPPKRRGPGTTHQQEYPGRARTCREDPTPMELKSEGREGGGRGWEGLSRARDGGERPPERPGLEPGSLGADPPPL